MLRFDEFILANLKNIAIPLFKINLLLCAKSLYLKELNIKNNCLLTMILFSLM